MNQRFLRLTDANGKPAVIREALISAVTTTVTGAGSVVFLVNGQAFAISQSVDQVDELLAERTFD